MATLFVNAGGAAGGPGTFTNLESAVNAAASGDTIVLAPGTVLLEDPSSQDGQVFIAKNVNVIGSGKTSTTLAAITSIAGAENDQGKAMIVVNAGFAVNFGSFTIDGGDVGPDVNVATGILFEGTGTASNMVITNIGTDNGPQPRGTGILASNVGPGTVVIDGVDFSQNERVGVSAWDGRTVIVQNSTFTAKTVDDDESPSATLDYAIDNQGSTATLINNTYTGYLAKQDGFDSAAVLSVFGTTTVSGGTFTNNLFGMVGFGTGAFTINGTVTSNSTLPGALALVVIGDLTASGANNLTGNAINIEYFGGAAANTFVSGAGNDALNGDDGTDDFTGAGGNDSIDGGAASDTARFTGASSEYVISILANGDIQVADTVPGRDGTDLLRDVENIVFSNTTVVPTFGTAGPENIPGTENEDIINAGGGDDTISSGGGNDAIDAGSGDDLVITGAGNDNVAGGTGDDNIFAGEGDDVLNGGSGDDAITADAGNDTVHAGSGDDTVVGGDGDDNMAGETGNDYIVGGIGNDSLFGGDGTDSLNGDENDDYLVGGMGADSLYGGDGNDSLIGEQGNEWLVGGDGADGFVFAPGSGVDTVVDFTQGEDRINLDAYNTNFAFVQSNASQSGANTVIDLGGGDQIVILNFTPTSLQENDFNF